MDDRLLDQLEASLADAPELASWLIDWLRDFAQRQACRESRKKTGMADDWRQIEEAAYRAQRVLAGDK